MIDLLRNDLERDEGLRLKVYKCPAGYDTIGYGRNLESNPLSPAEVEFCGYTTQELRDGALIVEAHAVFFLQNDIERVIKQLDAAEPWWITRPDNVRRGLANMVFQMGLRGVQGFKRMMASLQAGDYAGAKREALDSKWAKVDSPKRAERVTALFHA